MQNYFGIAISFLISIFHAGGLAAPASAADDPNKPIAHQAQQAPDAYMTEEILSKAKPMVMPTIPPEELARLLKQQREFTDLPSSHSAPLGVPVEADVSVFPYAAAGKLFVWFPETPTDNPESCSGQFVGGLNVILTAAHCLQHQNNGVHVRMYGFNRAYRSGDGTSQHIRIKCYGIMNGWTQSGVDNYRYDYAFLKTETASNGGFFGLQARLPSPSIEAIGYPKNFGDTKRMQRVLGTRGTYVPGHIRMDHNPFGHGLTGGASGGAWHENGSIVGINSRWLEGMWSPEIDSHVITLWRYANNDCR
jgi:hypothetical protein